VTPGKRLHSSEGEPRFDAITETTGTSVLPEAADMLLTRYALAADQSQGKRVLELGCGGGQGFGLLLRNSRSLVGGDFSAELLSIAHLHYRDRVPLVRLDAQALPFASDSFDLVLLFEAAYYIPDLRQALREIARVLSKSGNCLIVSANPERPDFIPSPFSVRYHSGQELAHELQVAGLAPVFVQAGFPTSSKNFSFVGRMLHGISSQLRKVLAWSGLVPKTLKGRSRLKRILYPLQVRVPAELGASFGKIVPLVDLRLGSASRFKVIYVMGSKEPPSGPPWAIRQPGPKAAPAHN
jgi:SAM-dependent methyltransferase